MVSQLSGAGQSCVLNVAAGRVYRLRKSVMTSARLITDRTSNPSNNVNGWRYSPRMITLTYSQSAEWRPEHVSKFLDAMSKWAKRRGFSLPYLWVMELTKKGKPHYHVIVWCPRRFNIPKPDKRGWWPHGSTKTELVRNSVGYVAKYASKFASKDAAFPKGARIHGVGGMRPSERRIVAWWKLPKDLRTGEEGSVVWRRKPGGGWFNPETREVRYSEWVIDWFSEKGKFVGIRQVAPDPVSSHFREHSGWVAKQNRSPDVDKSVYSAERQEKITLQSEEVADRLWRECLTRQESWQEQLETDRVGWLMRVEREAHLTPFA